MKKASKKNYKKKVLDYIHGQFTGAMEMSCRFEISYSSCSWGKKYPIYNLSLKDIWLNHNSISEISFCGLKEIIVYQKAWEFIEKNE